MGPQMSCLHPQAVSAPKRIPGCKWKKINLMCFLLSCRDLKTEWTYTPPGLPLKSGGEAGMQPAENVHVY